MLYFRKHLSGCWIRFNIETSTSNSFGNFEGCKTQEARWIKTRKKLLLTDYLDSLVFTAHSPYYDMMFDTKCSSAWLFTLWEYASLFKIKLWLTKHQPSQLSSHEKLLPSGKISNSTTSTETKTLQYINALIKTQIIPCVRVRAAVTQRDSSC